MDMGGYPPPQKIPAANAELVKSSTKNVYRLLKAYVRKGAALCGLGVCTISAARASLKRI